MEPRTGSAGYEGHRVAYRVMGAGPALVLVKPHRAPKDYAQLRLLASRFQVFQINPLGFGASDRPDDYPRSGIHEQILAVLDQEGVDRFIVWGYAEGSPMAAAIAQATPRVDALVAGGFAMIDVPSDAWMARMDREQRVPVAPRTFWHWFKRFDWLDELAKLPCPRLIYIGADDRDPARRLRQHHDALTQRGVTIVEFAGLDHQTCNTEPAISTQVAPEVTDWLQHHLGDAYRW